ncbi:MAG: hypothetical protein P8R54_06920 [Myxococcota bacterium]|nr:hypothetical protein [Myxococcota bacterium]
MMRVMMLALVAGMGCDEKEEKEPSGLSAFGNGSHDISDVTVTEIANSDDGLDVPRDLEFNPAVEGELWIVNRADDSVTVVFDAGTDSQDSTHIIDSYALHFMEEPSSISFGAATFADSDALTFGTCQESRNTYNDNYAPNDFMGPSLWSADLDLFGESNPDAIDYLSKLFGFYADLGSHLDMLHESPLCMGIAWETENVYWVFDGSDGNIVRYDFADDHDLGYDDHSDGVVSRHVEIEVERVEDVPSHMDIDPATNLLYVADTGNNRILVVDTTAGEEGDRLQASEPGVDHHEMENSVFSTFIDGAEYGLGQPSGLTLVDDYLLVSDHATGNLFAFNLDGELVDWVATGLEGLMGIDARSIEDIWVVDSSSDKVLRIQP